MSVSTSGDMSAVEAIVAKHRSNGHRICYAVSLGEITVKHSSQRIEARTLRCTKDIDASGSHRDGEPDHRDGNCCWRPHPFPPHMAGPPEPDHRQTEVCVECDRKWPCDVAKIAATLEAEREDALNEVKPVAILHECERGEGTHSIHFEGGTPTCGWCGIELEGMGLIVRRLDGYRVIEVKG